MDETTYYLADYVAEDIYNLRNLRRLAAELTGKERTRAEKGAEKLAQRFAKDRGPRGCISEDAYLIGNARAAQWAQEKGGPKEGEEVPRESTPQPTPKARKPKTRKPPTPQPVQTPAEQPAAVEPAQDPSAWIRETLEAVAAQPAPEQTPAQKATAATLAAGGTAEETPLCLWLYLPPTATEARDLVKAAGYKWAAKRQGWYIANPNPTGQRRAINNPQEVTA